MGVKLYNKSLAVLTGGVIALSFVGCSKKDASKESSSGIHITSGTVVLPTTRTTTKLVTTKTTTSLIVTSTTSTTTASTTSNISTEPTTEEAIFNEYDNAVISQFNVMGADVKNSFDSTDFLDKGKAYFIYCVDFLFCGGQINGISFSDISDGTKSIILNDIMEIDGLICSKFPNYKETISEGSSNAYNKASEIIHSGSTNVKDYSREKLGEDNYDKIKGYKDLFVEQTGRDWNEFKGVIGEGYDKGKAKIKDWYENFKKEQ